MCPIKIYMVPEAVVYVRAGINCAEWCKGISSMESKYSHLGEQTKQTQFILTI
jgi:hypothetical protein